MLNAVVILRAVLSFALLIPSLVAPAAALAAELTVSDVRIARDGASARVHFTIVMAEQLAHPT